MDGILYTGLYTVLWLFALRGHALDCQHAQAQCTEDHTCAEMMRMVPKLCGNSESETTCDVPDRLKCEGILQILRQNLHFRGCDCEPSAVNYQECRAVYTQLNRKQCTDSDDDDVVEDVPTQPVKDTWQYMADVDQVGLAPNGESTCIEALKACNVDTTCRQSLYEYLTECRGDPAADTCRRTACQHSIRAFLDVVSPRYTHPLLYCYCATDDTQCDAVWQGLNAQCAYKLTPLPNCQDVKEQCSRSVLCSTNFENYKFQCAVSDATGTGCAQSYGACRDARLGILGTIVAASCTCRGVEGRELDACQQQQRIVLDNPCFARAGQAYYPPARNQNGAHTTAQPQIHINKRVSSKEGCEVRLWNGYPDVHIATGHNIRIASDDRASCTQICCCEKTGYLFKCFDVLCNVTRPCNEGVGISRVGAKDCVCTGTEQICIDVQTSLDVGSPAMMIGYSVMELKLIERQLHVSLIVQSVVSKLQHTLSGVYPRNPCELEAVNGTHGNGTRLHETIVIVAHSEYRQKWECMNQLSDLVAMINSRAPPIASDVILSMIKIASLIEGAPEEEQTQPRISYARSSATRVLRQHVILQLVSSIQLLVTLTWY